MTFFLKNGSSWHVIIFIPKTNVHTISRSLLYHSVIRVADKKTHFNFIHMFIAECPIRVYLFLISLKRGRSALTLGFCRIQLQWGQTLAVRSNAQASSVLPDWMRKLGCVNVGGFGWWREGSKEAHTGLPTNKEIRAQDIIWKSEKFCCICILSF